MTSATIETEAPKKRGRPAGSPGRQGPLPWREKPTQRERVLNQNLAEAVKRETGLDVSPDTVRAVEFTFRRWNVAEETKDLRKRVNKKIQIVSLQDKRQKALDMLKEAESELEKLSSVADLEEEEEIDEDEDYDEDEDVFDDDSDEKVQTSF